MRINSVVMQVMLVLGSCLPTRGLNAKCIFEFLLSSFLNFHNCTTYVYRWISSEATAVDRIRKMRKVLIGDLEEIALGKEEAFKGLPASTARGYAEKLRSVDWNLIVEFLQDLLNILKQVSLASQKRYSTIIDNFNLVSLSDQKSCENEV